MYKIRKKRRRKRRREERIQKDSPPFLKYILSPTLGVYMTPRKRSCAKKEPTPQPLGNFYPDFCKIDSRFAPMVKSADG
jgi:hypothetical protein